MKIVLKSVFIVLTILVIVGMYPISNSFGDAVNQCYDNVDSSCGKYIDLQSENSGFNACVSNEMAKCDNLRSQTTLENSIYLLPFVICIIAGYIIFTKKR